MAIQFLNNVAVDTSVLFVDTVNDRVGIGIASPAYLLDVNEDDNVLAFRVTGGGGGVPIASFVRDVGATGSSVNINAQSNFPQIQFISTGNTFSVGGDSNGNFKISDNTAIGTNDRITIDNTGNVGIGTTSPSNKLDVNGIIEADKLILPTAGTSGAGTVTTPAGKLDVRSDSTFSNSAIVARGTTNQNPVLAFYRPTGSAATSYPWWLEANGSTFQIKTGSAANIGSESVSTKVTINSSGNVGIGTTSPDRLLVLNHASDTRVKMQVNGTDTAQIQTLANEARYHALGSGTSLQLWTNGSEKMRITSSGNVGIGTTSPVTRLDLGTINTIGGGLGFGSTSSELRRGNSGSNVQLSHWGNLSMIIDSDGNDTTRYFNIMHNSNDSSLATELFRVQENGNVGIGTTSPATKLQVGSGSADDAARVYFSDGSYTEMRGYGLQFNRTTSYIRPTADNTSSLNIGDASHTWNTLITDASTTIFRVNASEKMRITSTGNVGIGTTSPVQKVHIDGGSSNAYLHFSNTDSGASASDGADIGITGDEDLVVWNREARNLRLATSGIERIRINSSGNVGIGTTSPNQKLEVSSSSVPTIRINNTKNGSWTAGEEFGGLEFYGNDASGEGPGVKGYVKLDSANIFGAAFDMGFGTTNGVDGITEKMVITHAGRVGIGTTSPSHTLDVDGYIAADRYVDTDNASFYIEPGSGTTGQWKFQTPSGYVSIGPNNSSYSHFYTDRGQYYFDKKIVVDSGVIASYNEDLTFQAPTNSTRMVINSSTGNVGIGTTNPGVYRLNVSGLVNFQTSSIVPGFEVANTTGGTVQRNTQAEDSNSSTGSECLRLEHAGVDDGNFGLMITFRDSNGNIKGKISSTSTSTTYATSSDQRLKEDPKDFDALNLISQIQPYDFKWKTSGERDFGFYAQELNEVLPQAVDVPTLDDGVTIDEDAMLMADYTKLVPVLVKAIQQLKDKIQTLENQ